MVATHAIPSILNCALRPPSLPLLATPPDPAAFGVALVKQVLYPRAREEAGARHGAADNGLVE